MATFRNPKIYVTTPEPTPWDRLQRTKRIAAILFAVLFAVGLFWLLFFSPIFAVSEILVEGPAADEMRGRFQQFLGKNIFRLDSDRVQSELSSQYPFVKSIVVYRGLPNALKIEVVTRKEALVWESGSRKFLIDFEGIPFTEVTSETEQTLAPGLSAITEGGQASTYLDLPLVTDTHTAPVTIGTPLLTSQFVQFVLALHRDFQPTTGLALTALKVGETTFQIEAVTNQNFSVFFDTTRRADRQLAALQKLVTSNRDLVKEYVDLRVAGKAYVK